MRWKVLENRKKPPEPSCLILCPTAGPIFPEPSLAELYLACSHVSRDVTASQASLARALLASLIELCQWLTYIIIFLLTVELKMVHSPKYLKTALVGLRNASFFLMCHVIKEKHINNRVGGSSGKLYFTKRDLLFCAVNQPYAALDEVKTHLKSILHTVCYVLVLHVTISLNRLISYYTDDL